MESNHDWTDKMRENDPAAMPPGFDWESMKEGIYRKMEKERKKPAFFWFGDLFSGKKRWISLSIIAVLFSGLFFFSRFFDSPVSHSRSKDASGFADHEKTSIPHDAVSNASINKKTDAGETNTPVSAQSTGETEKTGDLSRSSLSGNTLTQNKRDIHNVIRRNNDRLGKSPAQDTRSQQRISPDEASGIPDPVTQAEKKYATTVPESEGGSTFSQNEKENTPADKTHLQEEHIMASFVSIAFKTHLLPLDDLSFKTGIKLEDATPPSPSLWYAGITTGAGFGPSYSVAYDLPGGVEASEKLLCAPFVTAYIKKPLTKGFYTGTGLHVQSFISRLKYNSERMKNYSVKDTVLLVERNQITGKETIHRGDTTASLLTRRRLKHVNTTSAISIPLIAGWLAQKGLWSYSVQAGMEIGIYALHRGKSYNEEADIYAMDSQGPYSKNLGLSFSGDLAAGYALSHRLKLRVSAGYRQYLTTWRKDPAAQSLKPKIVNIGMGIEYNLSK